MVKYIVKRILLAVLILFGVSVITNCGLSDEVGDHEDVQRQGAKAGRRMAVLFRRMIKNL